MIAGTFYKSEYKYLEYLYHVLTECVDAVSVETGCPFPKCKAKRQMTINELRLHLLNECNKVPLECSLCKATFRRPWKPYHDCRREYITRLQERDDKIRDLEDTIMEKERELQLKNRVETSSLKVPATPTPKIESDFARSDHFFDKQFLDNHSKMSNYPLPSPP